MRQFRFRNNRRHQNPRRLVDRIAEWLQRSSYTKLVVSFGATISFALGVGLSIRTAYKEYVDGTIIPVLSIRMEQVQPTTHLVTMAQMAGLNIPGVDRLGTEASTFAVSFELTNPTSRRVTVSDCILEIKLTRDAEGIPSEASLSFDAITNHQVERPFSLSAEPGATVFAERVFVFTKVKFEPINDFSKSSERQSNLTCFDEKRKGIESGWPLRSSKNEA